MSEGNWGALTPSFKRCTETRAHYAHEWYNPLRQSCPGGPTETDIPPGPCWHDSGHKWFGETYTAHCELLAGHEGAHTATDINGGTAVWTEPEEPSA